MNYDSLKKRLTDLKESGELIDGIKLDKATTVANADKFVGTHLHFLEPQERLKKEGKQVCMAQVKPFFRRLKKYLKEVEKIKSEKKQK